MEKQLNENELNRLDGILIQKIMKVDIVTFVVFFMIPALSYFISGRVFTIYSIPVMSTFLLVYIAYFWNKTQQIHNLLTRKMLRAPSRGNRCAFYVFCILTVNFLVIVGVVWSVKFYIL